MMGDPWRKPILPEHLSQDERDGLACVYCGRADRPMQPVEVWNTLRNQLFECIDRDACDSLMDQPPESSIH